MTRGSAIGLLIGALAGGLAVWGVTSGRERPPPAPARLVVALPSDVRVSDLVVSPNGRRIVYAGWAAGRRQLHLRDLDRFEGAPIPGTEGAAGPFFSADGQWLGFFADGSLWKLRLSGGTPQRLCPAPTASAGASWGADDRIVFAQGGDSGLRRISAEGGDVEELTHPDRAVGEVTHGWPFVLPGADGVLFTIATESRGSAIAALSLESATWTSLLPGTGRPQLGVSGQLVYAHAGELQAAGFDADRLELAGAPRSAGESISTDPLAFGGLGRAGFSLSRTGTLVYIPAPPGADNALVWVDRNGQGIQATESRARHHTPRLSPDDGEVAVVIRSGVLGRHIWIYDLDAGTRVQLTVEGSDNRSPVWTGPGRALTFASNRSGPQSLYRKPARAGGKAEPLSSTGDALNPTSWSAASEVLAFYVVGPDADRDIWTLRPGGEPTAFLTSPLNERSAMISPDGRWLAYVAGAAGLDAIYVAPYPDPGATPAVRIGDGGEPVWARDGRELFYRHDGRMMVASVSADAALTVGGRRALFEDAFELDPGGNTANYDVTTDGRRFLMVQNATPPRRLRVVLDWTAPSPR